MAANPLLSLPVVELPCHLVPESDKNFSIHGLEGRSTVRFEPHPLASSVPNRKLVQSRHPASCDGLGLDRPDRVHDGHLLRSAESNWPQSLITVAILRLWRTAQPSPGADRSATSQQRHAANGQVGGSGPNGLPPLSTRRIGSPRCRRHALAASEEVATRRGTTV